MFCINCGKEIAENAKFCSYCGSENNISNKTYVDATVVNDAVENSKTVLDEKPKKKKTNILIVLLVMLVAGFIGKNVIAPSMLSDSEDSSYNQNQSENDFTFENNYGSDDVTNSNDTANSSYLEIFNSRYIIDGPTLFIGHTTDCFAMVDEGGNITKLAYGHTDDVIYEMEQTLYLNVENMTETEKNNLIATVKEEMKAFENSSACELTYNETSSYFYVIIRFSALDQKINMQEAEKLMGSTGKSGDYFSMSITEQNLLNAGFVKK